MVMYSWPADMGTWIPEVTPTGLACMSHVGHVPGAWIPEVTPTGLTCMPHVGHVPTYKQMMGTLLISQHFPFRFPESHTSISMHQISKIQIYWHNSDTCHN